MSEFDTINFSSYNYFDMYPQMREGFIASTITTVASNHKSMNHLHKVYKEMSTEINKVCLKGNPWLKYKKIVNPSLWKNFKLVADLFHYVDSVRFLNLVNPVFLEVSSFITSDLTNARKNNFKVDMGKLFDNQMDRLIKAIDRKYKNPKNNESTMFEEAETTIVYMTLMSEFFGRSKTHVSNPQLFQMVSTLLANFTSFYVRSLEITDRSKELHELSKKNFPIEMKAIYNMLGILKTAKEYKISVLQHSATIISNLEPKTVRSWWEGSTLQDSIIYDVAKSKELKELRDKFNYKSDSSNYNTNFKLISTLSDINYVGIGTEVVETDALIISKVKLDSIIMAMLMNLHYSKVSMYLFVEQIVHNARIQTLLTAYDKELDKATGTEIIEIVKEDLATIEELSDARKTIQDLSISLEARDNLEKENNQMRLEIERLKKELCKKDLLLEELQQEDADTQEDEESAVETIDTLTEQLKDTPIILLGGAEKYAQRVKKLLPHVVYYSPDDLNKHLTARLKNYKGIVVYNTELTSHSMTEFALPTIKSNKDIKLVTVNKHLNLDLFVKEIVSRTQI